MQESATPYVIGLVHTSHFLFDFVQMLCNLINETEFMLFCFCFISAIDVMTKERGKRNGFERPYDELQVTSWILFPVFALLVRRSASMFTLGP